MGGDRQLEHECRSGLSDAVAGPADPSGIVTVLPATWPGAEGVRFVPWRGRTLPPCSFGGQEFFTNIFVFAGPGSVTGYPASEGDFAGLNGRALVPSENPTVGSGAIDPSTLTITPLAAPSLGQHEASTFDDHSPGCQ